MSVSLSENATHGTRCIEEVAYYLELHLPWFHPLNKYRVLPLHQTLPAGAWDVFNSCSLENTFPPEQNEAQPDREADCSAGRRQEGDKYNEAWTVWEGGEVEGEVKGRALRNASGEIPRIRE